MLEILNLFTKLCVGKHINIVLYGNKRDTNFAALIWLLLCLNRLTHNSTCGFCHQAETNTRFNFLKSVAMIHH